jgi:hypothetical protein
MNRNEVMIIVPVMSNQNVICERPSAHQGILRPARK